MNKKFLYSVFWFQLVLFLVLGPFNGVLKGQLLDWSSQIQISDDPSRSEFAHIVIDSQDNKHIFWMEGRNGIPLSGFYWYSDIYYSKLDRFGNVLIDQKPILITYSAYCHLHVAADSNDDLHLVWTDGRLHAPGMNQYSNWEVYYRKLNNNGNTIINDFRLTNAIYFSGTPYIQVDQADKVHIVWSDLRHRHEWSNYWPTEAYYSKLDINGIILIDNKRITFDHHNTGWPTLAIDTDGNIHMTHYKYDYISGPNNRRVVYTKLDNDGNILIPEFQTGSFQSAVPNIAVDSNDDLHCIWIGTKDGVEGDVWTTYYKKLDKYGATLVDEKAIGPGNLLSIAMGPGDNVHVASIIYGNSLYYTMLDANGNIIYNNNGNPIDTSSPPSTHMHSNFMGVDSTGNVHIVWSKLIGPNSEVFCISGISNQAPVAVCKDVEISADENCQAVITPQDIDGGSYDPDEGDEITLSLDNTGPFSPGIHSVTLTVTDQSEESDSCVATVTVVDNTAPVINTLTASPNVLWPPNHKMVEITVTANVSDNCDSNPLTKIVSVSSNEPVNGTGDGNTSPDWEITGDLTVNLRAERSGNGTGRIYTITVMSLDTNGNSSTKDVYVTVPHSKKKK